MRYEKLVRSMRDFLRQRAVDGTAYWDGKLPILQQKKMDSIIRQAVAINNKIKTSRGG